MHNLSKVKLVAPLVAVDITKDSDFEVEVINGTSREDKERIKVRADIIFLLSEL